MKKFISIVCCFLVMTGLVISSSYSVMAEETTVSFEAFLADLLEDGVFDGNGATVRWKPDEQVTQIQRIQDENAQYQIDFTNSADGTATDVVIRNANFEYVPADIPDHNDAWNSGTGSWTADQVRNAEFQLLNIGDVTVENCSFEKIIVSPFGQNSRENDENRTFIVNNCTFSNVYNKYALKDIYPHSATITNNKFVNCSGAIYFEGGKVGSSVQRGNIVVANNTFDNIDTYCPDGKQNTRGIIQLSDDFNIVDGMTTFDLSNNQVLTNTVNNSENNSSKGLPVIRLITTSGTLPISGWTEGEPLSVVVNTAGASLPTLSSEPKEINGVIYTFRGWLDSSTYKGATATYPEDTDYLPGGSNQTVANEFYYAVWKVEEAPEPSVEPTPTSTSDTSDDDHRSCDIKGDLNCDGVVTCDEAMGPGWVWNEESKACVMNTPVEASTSTPSTYQLVNTSDK